MSAVTRWGFLGAGAIARTLAPAVHAAEGAVLQAVGARDPDRARRLGPVGRAYDSYAAVLADPAVDAVYIALANDAHEPWTSRALAAGKHVLCEKPMGLTGAEVRTMTAAAEAADRLLVEAFWYRWHPRTVRAEALVRGGALGPVERVSAAFLGGLNDLTNFRFDPSLGGGALYDVGCYAVSAALWGAGWADLGAVSATLEPTDVDDPDRSVDARGHAELTLGDVRAEVRFGIRDDPVQTVEVTGGSGRLAFRGPAFMSRFEVAELAVDDRIERFAPVDPYQVMVESVSRRIRGDGAAWVMPLAESLRVADALDAIFAAGR